jgi:4-diphosphocytidyl-2-C-methyl-D-erythritol kinase
MAQTEPRKSFREFAPAKVNLFLHVLGKRADGYHDLDSLVVFADVGDHLAAAPEKRWGLTVTGPYADQLRGGDPADNLVVRAARVTEEWAWGKDRDLSPLHFTLEKHLPVASGIGGGSADAGAAMRLCAHAAGLALDADLYARAAALGADVPVCLFGKPAWMSGLGEKIEPAALPGGFGLLLVNPGVEVATAEVFKRLGADPVARKAVPRQKFKSADALISFLAKMRNDLEAPAREIAPVIGEVLDNIEKTSPMLARMSGSGATCFGLYACQEDADAAAHAVREARHDWWISS